MSEFDKLKDDAAKYAQQHPEQVEKGEEAVERKLGLPEQGGPDQSGPGPGTGGEDQQNAGPGGGQ